MYTTTSTSKDSSELHILSESSVANRGSNDTSLSISEGHPLPATHTSAEVRFPKLERAGRLFHDAHIKSENTNLNSNHEVLEIREPYSSIAKIAIDENLIVSGSCQTINVIIADGNDLADMAIFFTIHDNMASPKKYIASPRRTPLSQDVVNMTPKNGINLSAELSLAVDNKAEEVDCSLLYANDSNVCPNQGTELVVPSDSLPPSCSGSILSSYSDILEAMEMLSDVPVFQTKGNRVFEDLVVTPANQATSLDLSSDYPDPFYEACTRRSDAAQFDAFGPYTDRSGGSRGSDHCQQGLTDSSIDDIKRCPVNRPLPPIPYWPLAEFETAGEYIKAEKYGLSSKNDVSSEARSSQPVISTEDDDHCYGPGAKFAISTTTLESFPTSLSQFLANTLPSILVECVDSEVCLPSEQTRMSLTYEEYPLSVDLELLSIYWCPKLITDPQVLPSQDSLIFMTLKELDPDSDPWVLNLSSVPSLAHLKSLLEQKLSYSVEIETKERHGGKHHNLTIKTEREFCTRVWRRDQKRGIVNIDVVRKKRKFLLPSVRKCISFWMHR